MTFIRIKKIKGQEYAYLIKNRWLKTKARPKQKVIGYLGKILRPDAKQDMSDVSFFDHTNIMEIEDYIQDRTKKQILGDLIDYELSKHDSGVELNFDSSSIKKKGREVVLKINEGYLCKHTIKELKRIEPKGEEEEVGLALAKGFVDAGIAIPREIFIGYFGKVFK